MPKFTVSHNRDGHAAPYGDVRRDREINMEGQDGDLNRLCAYIVGIAWSHQMSIESSAPSWVMCNAREVKPGVYHCDLVRRTPLAVPVLRTSHYIEILGNIEVPGPW